MSGGLVLDVSHVCVNAKASLAVVKDNFSFRNSEPRQMQEMVLSIFNPMAGFFLHIVFIFEVHTQKRHRSRTCTPLH